MKIGADIPPGGGGRPTWYPRAPRHRPGDLSRAEGEHHLLQRRIQLPPPDQPQEPRSVARLSWSSLSWTASSQGVPWVRARRIRARRLPLTVRAPRGVPGGRPTGAGGPGRRSFVPVVGLLHLNREWGRGAAANRRSAAPPGRPGAWGGGRAGGTATPAAPTGRNPSADPGSIPVHHHHLHPVVRQPPWRPQRSTRKGLAPATSHEARRSTVRVSFFPHHRRRRGRGGRAAAAHGDHGGHGSHGGQGRAGGQGGPRLVRALRFGPAGQGAPGAPGGPARQGCGGETQVAAGDLPVGGRGFESPEAKVDPCFPGGARNSHLRLPDPASRPDAGPTVKSYTDRIGISKSAGGAATGGGRAPVRPRGHPGEIATRTPSRDPCGERTSTEGRGLGGISRGISGGTGPSTSAPLPGGVGWHWGRCNPWIETTDGSTPGCVRFRPGCWSGTTSTTRAGSFEAMRKLPVA